eukprot:TRINITY_DN17660_c0_g1_i1.p1 TRINITY_DN17660_c0_g1~~TRINITY_DN17660_c0_g1_i1.p1  ORF type:complete len:118 (+),score=4.55 TRINITY_DN17660_c0_g1_i1:222-575(+)
MEPHWAHPMRSMRRKAALVDTKGLSCKALLESNDWFEDSWPKLLSFVSFTTQLLFRDMYIQGACHPSGEMACKLVSSWYDRRLQIIKAKYCNGPPKSTLKKRSDTLDWTPGMWWFGR